MEKKFKCFICGTIGGFFFLTNTNPICEECLRHTINVPHVEIPNVSLGPDRDAGIEITTTATAFTTSSSSSSSSTSSTTTTTQPPEVEELIEPIRHGSW